MFKRIIIFFICTFSSFFVLKGTGEKVSDRKYFDIYIVRALYFYIFQFYKILKNIFYTKDLSIAINIAQNLFTLKFNLFILINKIRLKFIKGLYKSSNVISEIIEKYR